MLTKSTNTKYSYLRRVMVLPILIATVCLVSIKVNASEKFEKKIEEIKNEVSLLVSDTSNPAKQNSEKSIPTPPAPPNPHKVNKTVSKGNKITVTSKTSVDTLVWSASYAAESTAGYPTNYNQAKYSNVTLTTKDKQKVLDALEKKANVVITKKTEGKTEKYIIVDNQFVKDVNKPAFYVNGEKVTEFEMKAISPNDIESINVLKGENAIKKYPEDGKDGVIEIKLKHKN